MKRKKEDKPQRSQREDHRGRISVKILKDIRFFPPLPFLPLRVLCG
jgi:hypothetical protein